MNTTSTKQLSAPQRAKIPRCTESDGLGASLMAVRCAWCDCSMGAKVCAPAQAGLVSHGICPACAVDMRADFDRSRGLSCAVSSATAGRDRRNLIDAASGQGACPAPLPVAWAGSPAEPSEHACGALGVPAGPAASVTFNGDHNL